MSGTGNLDVIITAAGVQPTPFNTILANLLAAVALISPGYTANLPGILIEDISSTDTAAIVMIDSYWVETINSLDPFGANPFLLVQLGNVYGVSQDAQTNNSVEVVFTGTPGWPILAGFLIGDGAHQYAVQDSTIVPSGGVTPPIFCVATQPGSWAIPAGTVTQVVTSVPSGITLTWTNPAPGTPGAAAESEESFRAGVMQAGLAASQGMTRYLKTLLRNVPGVQPRLCSVRQSAGSWEVLVGGGDPYQVAFAIFQSLFDINDLVGSTIGITAITQANPGVVTTNINHGLVTGQNNVHIAGVTGMTAANGGPYTVTVLTPNTFSFGVDTTGFGAYVNGGVVTPNSRNQSISVRDYPDTYVIPFAQPLQQTVTIIVTWNTNSPNFVNPAAVAQFTTPNLVNYINSIAAGQPINTLELDAAFLLGIQPVLDPTLVTRLVYQVSINGVTKTPISGTTIIPGDPESYFFMTAANVTVNQG